MQYHEVKEFPNFFHLQGFCDSTLRQHYKLYTGYVKRYNELFEQYFKAQKAIGHLENGDMNGIKVDMTYALSAIKNHELFFDVLGGEDAGETPTDCPLAATIERDYGGIAQFLGDLRQTSIAGRGWCWVAYDLDQKFLFTYNGGTSHALPVWNAVPLLAIDLYGHSYFYDFGANKTAYVSAIIKNINWHRVSERFAEAEQRCHDMMAVR